jgi:hypothetical protein
MNNLSLRRPYVEFYDLRNLEPVMNFCQWTEEAMYSIGHYPRFNDYGSLKR